MSRRAIEPFTNISVRYAIFRVNEEVSMEIIGMLYLSNFNRLASQLKSEKLKIKKYSMNGFKQSFFQFKRMQIDFELVMKPYKTVSDIGALIIRTKDGKPLKGFTENDAEDLVRYVSSTFDSVATLTFTDVNGDEHEYAFEKGKRLPLSSRLFDFDRNSETEYLKNFSKAAFDCYEAL